MDRPVALPTLDQVRDARDRIRGAAVETPLVALELVDATIHLKLENLQPIGSFKLRGAVNYLTAQPAERLQDGVYTASAGNMAQGVAWAARRLGVPSAAVVPDTAPRAKLDAIVALGGTPIPVPPADWWAAMTNHGHPGVRGCFVHPFADPLVMAGNGTIALELLERLPELDAIYVPWGGGGLACGIAAAARALRPSIRIYACEVETAAPLARSLELQAPSRIANERSFVDGIGGPSVFAEMWPHVRALISEVVTVPVDAVADSVRLLARQARVVAEGAGATALAAALRADRRSRGERVACIVSGGNIDAAVLARILSGETPR